MKQITVTDIENAQSYTFNDARAEGSFIEKVEGFEYPTVIEAIEDVPNQGGSVYINSKFTTRRVGITALITCDRLEERRELLAALQQTGELKLVTFTTLDDLDLQFYAMVKNLIFPYTKMETPLLLELISPDYRFYGQELKEFITSQTTISGGASIPATIPMSLASEGEASSAVNNEGNEMSDPIFRIDGPGTEFTIGNASTGEELIIDYTITEGEYILVDVANKTVLLNGITNIYSAASGDWWSIPPGESNILFLAAGLSVATLLTISYRDAYNGV